MKLKKKIIRVYNQAEELVVRLEGRYSDKDIARIVEQYSGDDYVCYVITRQKKGSPVWSQVHGKFKKFQEVMP